VLRHRLHGTGDAMTDLRKAAEMALEAMQTVIDCRPIGYETMAMTREQRLREKDQLEIDTYKALRQTQDAIQALRQALAQPEQVLTARVVVTVEKQEPVAWFIQYEDSHEFVWSKPGGWRVKQALEIQPLYTAPVDTVNMSQERVDETAKSEHEQYGYLWFTHHMERRFTHYRPKEEQRIGEVTPLYTAPPKREWVGLTDDEAWSCWNWEDFQSTWKSMEAKLKDKNCG